MKRQPSEITNLASKTIDVGKLDNLRAFNTIRKFNLDIMTDIMGYTSRNRIEFYKNRLAKKQVIWMGYCNTSGLENMDYIITDPNLIYENEKNLYSEKFYIYQKYGIAIVALILKEKKTLPHLLIINILLLVLLIIPRK